MSISAIQFQNMINFAHIYIFINCSCEFYHLPHFHHLDLQSWWLFKARGTKALSGAWIFLGPPRGSGLLVLACIVQTPLIVMTNPRILWSVQKLWLVLEDCRQWSNNWFQKAMETRGNGDLTLERVKEKLPFQNLSFLDLAVDNVILPTTGAAPFLLCHGQCVEVWKGALGDCCVVCYGLEG